MSGAALPIQVGTIVPARAATPTKRELVGLGGIFIAAMMAGLNNRVGSLALADVRGALGLSLDDASWLTTAYSAGELIAMPFSAWFAGTLSIRRFELWTLGVCTGLAAMIPFVQDIDMLLSLRFVQGIAGGALIPVLMMAALKFLPLSIRLHGLALYAMTATFAPNLSIWLAGYWTDTLFDWRWVYWQIIPLAIVSVVASMWGLPSEPVRSGQFRRANWPGMAFGVPALGLVAITLDQGGRLDWFNSGQIAATATAGLVLLVVFLLTEWYHPTPFIDLHILNRRNLGLGFTLFLLLLVTLTSGSLLPSLYLASLQDYRPLQTAPIGLIVALPQLVLGSAVALLLYRKWIDARIVLASGLALIALACLIGAKVTADWNGEQFVAAQALQSVGQPMAVVSLLFLATSVVQPHEGPYVSGTINTIRAFGSLLGAAIVGQFITVRSRFHGEMLIDGAGLVTYALPEAMEPALLQSIVGQQSLVLSVADAYRLLATLALLSIPLALQLTRIPAPESASVSPPRPASSSSIG